MNGIRVDVDASSDKFTLAIISLGLADHRWGVPLPLLAGEQREIWRSFSPLVMHDVGEFDVSANSEYAVASVEIPQRALRNTASAVEETYQELIDVMRAHGYPHLLRAWHFIPDIHMGDGDDERYRQFCAGRAQAFASKNIVAPYAAATVIGSEEGNLVIQILAGKTAGIAIENPRQVSAFEYPRQYGPKSPSFTRAMKLADGSLLISGTASIVGHESHHPDDASAQLHESLTNIAELLKNAGGNYVAGHLRLYVRRGEDWLSLSRQLREAYPEARVSVLRGDICRRELLAEVEGFFAPESA